MRPPPAEQPLMALAPSWTENAIIATAGTVVDIPSLAVAVIPERPDTVTACQLLGLELNPIVTVDEARAIVRANVVRQCDRYCPSAAWGAKGATRLKLYGRCRLLTSANRRLKAAVLVLALVWFAYHRVVHEAAREERN